MHCLLLYDQDSKVLVGCDDGLLYGFETTGLYFIRKLFNLKIHGDSINDLKMVQHSKILNNKQILITCSNDFSIKLFYFRPENVNSPINEKAPI